MICPNCSREHSVVDGWTFKTNTTYDQSNPIGRSDAQITHNGWSVGGNKHRAATGSVFSGADQTPPGPVQALVGHVFDSGRTLVTGTAEHLVHALT